MKVKKSKKTDDASDEINELLFEMNRQVIQIMKANKVGSCKLVVNITEEGQENGSWKIKSEVSLFY